jgi:hypothetical protein
MIFKLFNILKKMHSHFKKDNCFRTMGTSTTIHTRRCSKENKLSRHYTEEILFGPYFPCNAPMTTIMGLRSH